VGRRKLKAASSTPPLRTKSSRYRDIATPRRRDAGEEPFQRVEREQFLNVPAGASGEFLRWPRTRHRLVFHAAVSGSQQDLQR
jgi:hypothetical protein